MHLERLQLTNFKNHAESDYTFSANVNCFVGDNGVGKTNILDAIYYLSFCKSYFNPIDSQNIRHTVEGDCDFFAIHGDYVGLEKDVAHVSCVLRRNQSKQIKFNKKTVSSFADHIGRIPLVIVTPSDQSLIIGGSELRRKFVDGILSQVDRQHLHNFLQYQKALDQRNRLLKQCFENRYFEEESIQLWDDQLARCGLPILEARNNFLKEFLQLFQDYFSLIADHLDERPDIVYQNSLGDMGESFGESDYLSALKESRRRDTALLYTTVGPHKDDLELLINQYPVKKFGSQGQQKTYLLALKLAQFEYISRHVGMKPILLLDDIFDKLDMHRIKQLMQLVGRMSFGQVFVTDTQQGRVEAIFNEASDIDHKIFNL